MMRSLIMVEPCENIGEMRAVIEAVTSCAVVSIKSIDKRVWFEIVHREGKTCPSCGAAIHDYGHGYCLKCWNVRSKVIANARELKDE